MARRKARPARGASSSSRQARHRLIRRLLERRLHHRPCDCGLVLFKQERHDQARHWHRQIFEPEQFFDELVAAIQVTHSIVARGELRDHVGRHAVGGARGGHDRCDAFIVAYPKRHRRRAFDQIAIGSGTKRGPNDQVGGSTLIAGGIHQTAQAVDLRRIAQQRRQLPGDAGDIFAKLTSAQQQGQEVEHQLLHIHIGAGGLDTLARGAQRIVGGLRQVGLAAQQLILQHEEPTKCAARQLQFVSGTAGPAQQTDQLKGQPRQDRERVQRVERHFDRQAHLAGLAVDDPPDQAVLMDQPIDQQVDVTLLVQRDQRLWLQQFAQTQEAALAVDRPEEREEPQTAVIFAVEVGDQRSRDLP